MTSYKGQMDLAREMARSGYGWEDIRFRLKIPETYARAIVRQEATRAALSPLRRRVGGNAAAEAQAKERTPTQKVHGDDPSGV
jgi:hypothetical protein